MDLEQCLDALTTSTANNEQVRQATQCLNSAKESEVISQLSRVAFSPDANLSRREAALVLLRPRLVGWNPTAELELLQSVQTQLKSALKSHTGGDDLFTWRLTSLVSGLICAPGVVWRDLAETALTFFDSVAHDKENNPSSWFRALLLTHAIFNEGNVPFPVSPAMTLLIDQAIDSQHDPNLHNRACQTASTLLKWCAINHASHQTPIPDHCWTLFRKLVNHAATELTSRAISRANTLLETLSAIVDANSMGSVFWEPHTSRTICALASELFSLDNPQSAKLVLHLTTDAWIALYKKHQASPDTLESFEVLWNSLRQLTETPSSPPTRLVENVLSWELDPENEAGGEGGSLLDDEDADLSKVAREESEKLVTALAEGDAPKTILNRLTRACWEAVSQPYETQYESTAGALNRATAWSVLALIGESCEDSLLSRKSFLTQVLAVWVEEVVGEQLAQRMSPKIDPVDVRFCCAKVRWSAVLFICELLNNELVPTTDLDLCFSIFQTLRTRISAEPVWKIRVKGLAALCRLGSDIGTECRSDLRFVHGTREMFEQWLIPTLEHGSSEDFSVSSIIARAHTIDPRCAEILQLQTMIRRLTVSCVSTYCVTLGELLQAYYSPLMDSCLQSINASASADISTADLCEDLVELAGRLIECAELVLHDRRETEDAGVFERLTRDANRLLLETIRLHGEHERGPGSSLETALLQAGAKAMSVLNPLEHRETLRLILPIIEKRLKVTDAVTVLAGVADRPVGVQGYRLEPGEASNTKLVVAQPNGLQTVFNINSNLIADQIGTLSFLKCASEKLLAVMTEEEVNGLLSGVELVIQSSPLKDIHVLGFSALQSFTDPAEEEISLLLKEVVQKHGRLPYKGEDLNIAHRIKQYFALIFRIISFAFRVLPKLMPRQMEIQDILYTMVDMMNPLRDLAVTLARPVTEFLPSTFSEEMLASAVDEWYTFFNLLLMSESKGEAEAHTNSDDRPDEEETDIAGVTADVILQFNYRMMKAFGQLCVPAFEKWLRNVYSVLLSVDDVSVVSRSAALVTFAAYIEVVGSEKPQLCPQLIGAALLYTRPKPVENETVLARLKEVLPSLKESGNTFQDSISSNPASDVNLLLPVADTLRQDCKESSEKDNEEVVQEFIDEHQGEVMRIQGALFCVGVAALFVELQQLENCLVQIEQNWTQILNHPLSSLSCRRVTLDCLGCAYLRICTRFPPPNDIFSKPRTALFSGEGFVQIMQNLFPLRDDCEDAQVSHDLLISWILGDLPSHMSLPQLSNRPELAGAVTQELKRILQTLKEYQDEEKFLVSERSLLLNRLDKALLSLH